MNVISKDVTPATFDLAVWREELLALNPWARGLTIDEDNAEFAAERQKATLARHAEGKDAWNTWATAMLALKANLEAAGQWTTLRVSGLDAMGGNEATRAWLDLAPAVFSTEAAATSYKTDVSFADLVFPGPAKFDHGVFNGGTGFDRAVFGGGARFKGAIFSAWAAFDRATFSRRAEFEGATFRNRAGFTDVTFSRSARFDGVVFNGDARFTDTTFGGEARFEDAIFSGRTRFVGAVFSSRTLMKRAQFKATANFAQAKFEEPATFERSVFHDRANFEGIDSAAAFSLDNATFHQVPSFIGATFKSVLRLDNVKTPRYRWLGYTPDKDARARFRELRRRAIEAQDRGRELEFFAQEFRTGRFHSKRFPPWVPKVWHLGFWLGLAFEGFSNFGRSLWRPLLWWLALAALFAAFYLGEHEDMRKARANLSASWGALGAYAATTARAWNDPPPCRIAVREPFASTDAVTEAIQLSLRSALVFDIGRSDSARRTYGCLYGLDQGSDQEYLRVSARVSMASTLQTLASGLLIFLFLLAVRNLLRLR